ncbi:MAG: hypothetical protein CW338_07565 [Clostridiales bacterium]|jgi:Transcription initiation factor TFIIIB, Brf1 subunit/Transcription initiation factor TFIIB|nr:hypothetical protein [Clostridiales bacterium]
MTKGLMAQLLSAETNDQIKAIAREHNLELDDQQISALLNKSNGAMELSDTALEMVSGGSGCCSDTDWVCPTCGNNKVTVNTGIGALVCTRCGHRA